MIAEDIPTIAPPTDRPELMDCGSEAEVRAGTDAYVAREEHARGEGGAVADRAVVCYVHLVHDEGVVADDRPTLPA